MSILNQCHCLNCGNVLPIVRVWWIASRARGFFLTKTTGVVCPGCGTKLVILQGRVVLAGLTIFSVGISSMIYVFILLKQLLHRDLTQTEFLLFGLTYSLMVATAHFRIAPRFARVRLPEHGESVYFPLSRRYNHDI